MQRTADFGNHIANTLLKQTDGVLDNTTALDTTVHVLNTYPSARNLLIGGLLLVGQAATARFLRRHDDFDTIYVKS
jgi:hypothetical protein